MMTTPAPIDDAATRAYWRDRARIWIRWAHEIERMTGRFNAPFIEAAGVGAGMRVLDLASGAGEPALSIAHEIGGDGQVLATDATPEMVDYMRYRFKTAGFSNLSCERADMEALPYEDNAFDRVTCRFGIMFAPDPDAALREALRVLKPGGRGAWMVWGPMEDTTVFAVLQREARAFLYLPPDPALPQFRFGEAGLLAGALERAGFAAAEERECRFDGAPPAGVAFWRPNLELAFADEFRTLDATRREALHSRLREAFKVHLTDDRYRYRLQAHIRIGTGDKPA